MNKKSHDNFDYENAEIDIWDAGGDPDYLSYNDPEKRDRYMKKIGLDPKKYGSKWDGSQGSNNKTSEDGCYLTTACVEARGLPDDCEELTILRQFRDTYLKNREGGEQEIEQYYKTAPRIVHQINAGKNAGEIWNSVYEEMVAPCVQMILQGREEDAFWHYRSCALKLTALSEINSMD